MPAVSAQGSDFATPWSAVARGLSGVANAAAQYQGVERHNEEVLLQKQKTEKHMDDVRWATDATFQLKTHLNEFMANPENNSKENFGQVFVDHATKQIADYEKNAPSKESLTMFREHMSSFTASKHDQALDLGMRTKISNTIESFNTQTLNALKSFRAAKSLPNSDPVAQLSSDFDSLRNNADLVFGKTSPKIANAIKADIEQNFVIEAMNNSPEVATDLLDRATSLDSKQRMILANEIEQRKNLRDVGERESFDQTREAEVSMASLRGDGKYIDLSEYINYYPEKTAIRLKAQDDEKINIGNSVHATIKDLSQYNLETQFKKLEEMRANAKTATDKEVYTHALSQVRQQGETQVKDPAGWLLANNPEVEQNRWHVDNATNDNERIAALTKFNETVLFYQGYPPEDLKGDDRNRFLNRPVNSRHILSLAEAENLASQVNNAQPSQVLSVFQQLTGRFPKEEHAVRALNDMVNLPAEGKSLRPEYQFVLLNKDSHWINSYIGALQGGESIKKLSQESYRDLEQTVDRNPTWRMFQKSMMGDNMGRSKEMDAFRNGVMTYANALIIQGNSAKAAVNSAVDRLVGENLGFAVVHGRPLAILRERPDKKMPFRTDDDIRNIGEYLQEALTLLDTKEVDLQRGFGGRLQGLKPEDMERKASETILENGFFQTSPDGQAAILYLLDSAGFPFQLVNKKGEPFAITFEDANQFKADRWANVGAGQSWSPYAAQSAKQPKYPDLAPKNGMVSKNWPVTIK